jgi:hypothetical protein
MAGLGEEQRGIDADYRTADLSMLQALGALNGQGQFGLFQGSNSTGTSTAKERGSILSSIGQAASVASSLASLFGGGK